MFALLVGTAWAFPVEGAAQLAIGEKGFDFIEGYVESQQIEIEEDDLGAEYECWDRVGISDFQLSVSVKDLDLEMTNGVLIVTASFEEVRGEDMQVYAHDEDWLDLCVTINRELEYIDIENLHVVLSLSPTIIDDKLVLEIVGEPSVSGNIDMDISWFPDGLTLYFFEDLIFDELGDAIAEELPTFIDEYANNLAYSGEIEFISFDVRLIDAEVTEEYLMMGSMFDIHYIGESDCQFELPEISGRSPQLAFSDFADSAVGVGVTEKSLNENIANLWSDGFFCFSEEDFAPLFDDLSSILGISANNLSASASISSPPQVVIENGSVFITGEGATLTVRKTDDNVIMLDATVDVQSYLELSVESAISTFGISVHDIEVKFDNLDVTGLMSDQPNADVQLKRFIEGWVVDELEERAQNITFFQSMFNALGIYVFVEQLNYSTGGLEAYLNFYKEGDPEVDLSAPDTSVSLQSIVDSNALVQWSGLDDRDGELAFSYRLDEGTWSIWTTDTEHTFKNLVAGTHVVEVKARDRWWNEDPLPAILSFEVEIASNVADQEVDSTGGCGCTTVKPRSGLLLAGCMALGVLLRRRRVR